MRERPVLLPAPVGWLLLLVLPIAACEAGREGSAAEVVPPDPSVVRIEQGLLRGARAGSHGVVAFLGVPYGLPPTGDRRWRPPEPPASWQGERDATRLGPACPQADGTADYYRRAARRLGREPTDVPDLGPTSEDCLHLNIWTPEPSREGMLPVFVRVHGGAGTTGSGADPLFRGEGLARHGLVVVTVNYRLGALGFLAHPALSAADPRGVSGNYALPLPSISGTSCETTSRWDGSGRRCCVTLGPGSPSSWGFRSSPRSSWPASWGFRRYARCYGASR